MKKIFSSRYRKDVSNIDLKFDYFSTFNIKDKLRDLYDLLIEELITNIIIKNF